jgi:hypothetical protein
MGIDVNGIALSSSSGTTLSINNGATSWMNVNTNGIVTRPQTPYMTAILNGQATFYSANPVTFGTVNANVGNCWNNSTGTWTCPVAGYYLVIMGGIAGGSGSGSGYSYGYPYIYKNGATYTFTHWNNYGGWDQCNLHAVVLCAANDTITMSINGPSGWYGAGGHCFFGIALII